MFTSIEADMMDVRWKKEEGRCYFVTQILLPKGEECGDAKPQITQKYDG